VSRGCPFNCEFCDIIEMFGRVPRVKTAAQVLAELDALRRLGARGPLFFVDDNFIGNRKAAAKLLPEVARWQRAHGQPFDLYTEASLDLATLPDLLRAMMDAGFSAVFVGIETPDEAALLEAGKRQNLRLPAAEAVSRLTAAGLEVFAGFIVGFDADDASTFERQRAFIQSLPIPRAMVGTLTALPGTQLWRRLEREGRLRADATGDQFDRTNFEPAMGDEALLAGYRRLLAELYTPEAFFARCALQLAQAPARESPLRAGALAAGLRALWRIGLRGPRRRFFWRLLAQALRVGVAAVPRAVTFAVLGEHMIQYTTDEVLPRLDRSLSELRAGMRGDGASGPSARIAASPAH
jgi:radical SAM superfamily enzyme YgiQ (UPF0313 family)